MRAVIVVVALAVGCGKSETSSSGGGGSSASAAGGSSASSALTGTWEGTWKRSKPAPGGGALVLEMGDKPVLKRVGTVCPPEQTPASVTLDGDRVTIEVATPEVQAKYTGVRNGREMSGELTTTCSVGTGTGTWTLAAK